VRRSQNSALWSEARNLLPCRTIGMLTCRKLTTTLRVSLPFEYHLGLWPWWLCYLCFLNAPGNWDDSRIPQELYLKLLDLSQGCLLCDSVFCKYEQVRSRLPSPIKEDSLPCLAGFGFRDALVLNGKISRHRQAAECGNGNVQSIWARPQLPLTVYSGKRRRLLEVAIRLLNLRTWLCGFKQIVLFIRVPIWKTSLGFLNPGIGLAAEVLAGSQPEEVSQS